jgi:hypothetical protein
LSLKADARRAQLRLGPVSGYLLVISRASFGIDPHQACAGSPPARIALMMQQEVVRETSLDLHDLWNAIRAVR